MESFSWIGLCYDLSGMGLCMFICYEWFGVFVMKMWGSDDIWVKFMDEVKILGDYLSIVGGFYRESFGVNRSKKLFLAVFFICVKNILNYEKEFKIGVIKNM